MDNNALSPTTLSATQMSCVFRLIKRPKDKTEIQLANELHSLQGKMKPHTKAHMETGNTRACKQIFGPDSN